MLNVSRSAISQRESVEGSSPSTQYLLQIASLLKISFEWLATGSNTNQNKIMNIVNEPEFSAEELEILQIIKKALVGKKCALLAIKQTCKG